MSENYYDLIVIGGGSGGHAAAQRAGNGGLKVALVDGSEELGGLCILKGCMPSKTLIETADRARAMREAGEFAIAPHEPDVDIDALRARTQRLVGGFQEWREKSMRSGTYELVRGFAKFTGPNEILVSHGVGTMMADHFVVASGSEIFVPEIEGLSDTPYWTSDEVVELPSLPESVAVLGTGAIGMECAHLLEGLGAKVTVIARSTVLGEFDRDISEAMVAISRDREIEVLEQTSITKVSHEGGEFILICNGETRKFKALVVATGRKPLTDQLDLEKASVVTAKGRIVIDAGCRTSQPHIYAVGDCASPLPVVHLAVIQGEAAAKNILNKDCEARWEEDQTMLGIFTDPEVVKVGLSKSEAEERGIECVEAKYDFMDQGKGEIKDARHCFVKLLAAKKDGRILGGAAIGPEVVDSSHVIQMALHQEMTVAELLDVPFYHPTLIEIWTYVAEDLLDELSRE